MMLRRLDWSDMAVNRGAAIRATAASIATTDAQVPVAGILSKRTMSYSVHLLNDSIYAEVAVFVELSTSFLFIGRSRRCA
jgi:hypothetical protein